MAFEPDIIVTSPDSPRLLLIAYVQTRPVDPTTDVRLRAYMAGSSCPAGLLVTPERMRLYRHMYTAHSPQSVDVVAEFGTREVLTRVPAEADSLERAVQDWLEDLPLQWPALDLPPDVRNSIEENLLPALTVGTVGAAHPRLPRTGS